MSLLTPPPPQPPLSASARDSISMRLVGEALADCCLAQSARSELLSSVGICAQSFMAQTGRVSTAAYADLWQRLGQQRDDYFFGMDPRPLREGSLGYLSRSAVAQGSLEAGLESALSFLGLMLQCFNARLNRQQSVAEIVIEPCSAAPSRAFADFTFWMIVHGIACWLCGRRIPILGIDLRSSEPAFIDDYKVMFTENLRFACTRSRMIFAADCLDMPIRRSAVELNAFVAAMPGNLLVRYRDPQSLGSRIRHTLRSQPPQSWPDSATLARSLFMSSATLRRRLCDEAQSYRVIRDTVRKELAIGWLADEQVDFASIASRLGFADTSSFYKAFRKWSGTNPGHYRNVVLSKQLTEDPTGQNAQAR
jgi:AraC-like DNA-binding protein